MNSNGLTAVGPPTLPRWLLFLRVAIIVFSFGILVAAAYNISLYDNYISVSSGPAAFLIFDVRFSPSPNSLFLYSPLLCVTLLVSTPCM